MSLSLTLAILAVAAIAFGAATWVGRRPVEPGRVRLVPMGAIQFVALVAMLLMAAHLVSLLSGHPLTSRYLG